MYFILRSRIRSPALKSPETISWNGPARFMPWRASLSVAVVFIGKIAAQIKNTTNELLDRGKGLILQCQFPNNPFQELRRRKRAS
jgi:hypothetical protein